MKTHKILSIIIIIIFGIIVSKNNKYKVLSNDNGYISVDRKGKVIHFKNISFKGDSITLWADYDFNYSNLK